MALISEISRPESSFSLVSQSPVSVSAISHLILLPLDADDGETPPHGSSRLSWLIAIVLSVLFHLWLVVTLAGIVLDDHVRIQQETVDTIVETDEVFEEIQERREVELANPEDRELDIQHAINAASIGEVQSDTPQVGLPTGLGAKVEINPLVHDLPRFDVSQGLDVSKTIVVAGTTGEGFIQVETALDRVTWEIASNLKERKLLVVWLIDASGSLGPQREIVAKRFRRIYGELGALEATDQIPKADRPVLSGVVAFGAHTTFVTKEPTDKFDDVLHALNVAPTDPSGVENVFTAVGQVIDRWQKYNSEQGRRILIIAITDEAGDDHGPPLETAIVKCQRHGAKAYVIGPAAPFGRRKGYVPYTAKENGKTYQLPVDLGPETVVVENIDLPFWYDGPQHTYLSSGFGPYALSRLVRETGGTYFMSNMATMAGLSTVGSFDPVLMKAFEPDYRFGSPSQFMRDMSKHPLRAAVVGAAEFSQATTIKGQGTPQMDFRVQPNNFRQVFTDAQKSAAVSSFVVESILSRIPPHVEKWYAAETSLRWKLAFNLNYGRLLAHRVRTMEYNSALAQIKTSYTDVDIGKKVNHFVFTPDRELNYATTMKKPAKVAEEMLKRVLEEAPGTPWALLASRELKDGFGIKVTEHFIPPPPPPPPTPPGKPEPPKPMPKLISPPMNNTPPTKPAPKPPEPNLPKL